ncbi:hypothetical protein BDV59DRAFT_180589, partial [Aspergillus ambiguus]|uniref:uncharacterized protein n=1 Tax=Aspergillus ambiguus TaxID=176160 RepID=UPI003CCD49CA
MHRWLIWFRKKLISGSKHVKDLGDILQQVVRVSKASGLGIYLLDRELRDTGVRVPWGDASDPECVPL